MKEMTKRNSKILEKRIGRKVKKTAPRVSVIIPAYNIADFIVETLESAFAQIFSDFEVILVNDGSPDSIKLEKNLQPYFDRIIYIEQENGGAAAARNTAIYEARGEFLAFLDGDDIWLPEYLESQINALSAKQCDLIYADALLFGDFRLKHQTFMTKAPSAGTVTAENLISAKCNVITSGTVVRREKVLQAELFDEDLPRIGMEDFDLWFRLVKNGARLDYQRKILLKYRVRPNSLSGTNVERAERSIYVLNTIYKKFELTEKEKIVWKEKMNDYQAQLELEKGKLCLVQGDFSKAQVHISQANKFYHKSKLSLINWLIYVSPKLTLKLFKVIRPTEFSFISFYKPMK
ncbi:hypothetical protein BH20ACI1_BH20ACI1_00560 [soil metagenome]